MNRLIFFKTLIVVLLGIALFGSRKADGAKILLVPMAVYSQVTEQVLIGEELVKMGHSVSLAIGNDFPLTQQQPEQKGIFVLRHKESTNKNAMKPHGPKFDKLIATNALSDVSAFEFIKLVSRGITYSCDAMFSDTTFMERLKKMNLDLIILDGLSVGRCLTILPKLLKVKFITDTSTFYEGYLAGISAPTSVIPSTLLAFTPEMDFFQRMLNFIAHVQFNTLPVPIDGEWLIEKYLLGENLSFRQLTAQTEFWLFGNIDPHMDYSLPMTTNMAFVGGMTAKPAKPLPIDLEEFVRGAHRGLVVMSFGSLAGYIPPYIFEKFFAAFAQLEQRFIVRAPDEYPHNTSSNIKLMTWLPQNDLLGHHNTKLFITHCGSNGQFEALYHGVPMLGLPFMPSDQQYNANRMKFKGFGLTLNLRDSTTKEIHEAIKEILNNPSFSKNIKDASAAFKSAPMTPTVRAAHWVDYISKYGGAYLRPPGADKPIWEHAMLDVMLFFLLVSVIVLVITSFIIFFICKKVYKLFEMKEIGRVTNSKNKKSKTK